MTHRVSVRSLLIQPALFHSKSFPRIAMTHGCLCVLCFSNLCCFTVNPFTKECDDTWVSVHSLLFFNLCCSTAAILWSGLSEIIQKAATRVALWPSVKSTKRCQSPNPKPRQHHMFASYEIGTSCPSLTAIKRYDLDESADVLLMDHLNYAPYVEYLLSFGYNI